MRATYVIVGFIVGALIGIKVGVYFSCDIYEKGNFCAMVALTTGPVGGLIGAVVTYFLAGRSGTKGHA